MGLLRGTLGHVSRAPVSGISAFISRGTQESLSSPPPSPSRPLVRIGQDREDDSLQTRRVFSPEPDHTGTLIVDFSASRTVRNKSVV